MPDGIRLKILSVVGWMGTFTGGTLCNHSKMEIILLGMSVLLFLFCVLSCRYLDGDYSPSVKHEDIRFRTPHDDENGSSTEIGEEDEEESAPQSSEDDQGDVEEVLSETEMESETDDPEVAEYLLYLEALKLFALTLTKNHEFFLNGEDTSECEAFHTVCNTHYTKGVACSYGQYVMRKTHAAFDWIETQLDTFHGTPLCCPQRWELELIEEFEQALTKAFTPKKKKLTNNNADNNIEDET
jgi:hypothetical protein